MERMRPVGAIDPMATHATPGSAIRTSTSEALSHQSGLETAGRAQMASVMRLVNSNARLVGDPCAFIADPSR
jgi:hypothetical protein